MGDYVLHTHNAWKYLQKYKHTSQTSYVTYNFHQSLLQVRIKWIQSLAAVRAKIKRSSLSGADLLLFIKQEENTLRAVRAKLFIPAAHPINTHPDSVKAVAPGGVVLLGGDDSGGSSSSGGNAGVGAKAVEGRRLVAPLTQQGARVDSNPNPKAKAKAKPSRGSSVAHNMDEMNKIDKRRPQPDRPSWWEKSIPQHPPPPQQQRRRSVAHHHPKSGIAQKPRAREPRAPPRNSDIHPRRPPHKGSPPKKASHPHKSPKDSQPVKDWRDGPSRPRGPVNAWQPPSSATTDQRMQWKRQLQKLASKIRSFDKVGVVWCGVM